MKIHIPNILALGLLFAASFTPLSASAQDHRQKTKNDWRNIGIGSAALGAVGLLRGDSFLTVAGAAGAAYSASRYEHDRKSQRADERRRAETFRKGYYYSHGHKYVKRTYWRNGHKYYKFVRKS